MQTVANLHFHHFPSLGQEFDFQPLENDKRLVKETIQLVDPEAIATLDEATQAAETMENWMDFPWSPIYIYIIDPYIHLWTVYIHACMHICIHANMHTLHASIHTYLTLLAYFLTYIHIQSHTHTHTQTDQQADRLTDWQTDRPTDIQYNRTQYNAIQYRPDQSRQRPDRDRDRQTETDRERQRDRHRDRETERQSERCQRDIQTYGHTDIDTHNTCMHAMPCLALPCHTITLHTLWMTSNLDEVVTLNYRCTLMTCWFVRCARHVASCWQHCCTMCSYQAGSLKEDVGALDFAHVHLTFCVDVWRCVSWCQFGHPNRPIYFSEKMLIIFIIYAECGLPNPFESQPTHLLTSLHTRWMRQ